MSIKFNKVAVWSAVVVVLLLVVGFFFRDYIIASFAGNATENEMAGEASSGTGTDFDGDGQVTVEEDILTKCLQCSSECSCFSTAPGSLSAEQYGQCNSCLIPKLWGGGYASCRSLMLKYGPETTSSDPCFQSFKDSTTASDSSNSDCDYCVARCMPYVKDWAGITDAGVRGMCLACVTSQACSAQFTGIAKEVWQDVIAPPIIPSNETLDSTTVNVATPGQLIP